MTKEFRERVIKDLIANRVPVEPDIVDRCRQPSSDPMRREAADEIIRLRQQVQELEKQLKSCLANKWKAKCLESQAKVHELEQEVKFLEGEKHRLLELVKEYRKQVLLEAADAYVRVEEIVAEGMLRRMAEDI